MRLPCKTSEWNDNHIICLYLFWATSCNSNSMFENNIGHWDQYLAMKTCKHAKNDIQVGMLSSSYSLIEISFNLLLILPILANPSNPCQFFQSFRSFQCRIDKDCQGWIPTRHPPTPARHTPENLQTRQPPRHQQQMAYIDKKSETMNVWVLTHPLTDPRG